MENMTKVLRRDYFKVCKNIDAADFLIAKKTEIGNSLSCCLEDYLEIEDNDVDTDYFAVDFLIQVKRKNENEKYITYEISIITKY